MSTKNAELRALLIEAMVLADGSMWEDHGEAVYGHHADAILEAITAAGWRLAPPVEGALCCDAEACWSHDGESWAGWER